MAVTQLITNPLQCTASWLSSLALATMLLVGCGPRGASLRIDGSSTVYPITEAVVEEFRKERPEVRVTAAFSGTTAGFAQFAAKEIEIWDASRPIRDEEKEKLKEAGIDFFELTVAYDGLAVVINPENDWAETLTVEQLREIWKPNKENPPKKWSDVDPNWPDENMKLYGPGTASGTFEYFTEAIVGNKGASRSDYTGNENDNVLVTGVSKDEYGLAYFGYAYYAENKDRLKLVAVDAGGGPVKPSQKTVSDGTYRPLARPLYIYVAKHALANPATAQFVKFYLKNAAELAKEVDYVPVPDDVQERNLQQLESALAKNSKDAAA